MFVRCDWQAGNIVNNLFKIAMRGYCIIIVTVRELPIRKGGIGMSIIYFMLRLFIIDDFAESAFVSALLCLADALLVWVVVLGKIFGWW